jgi:hypothetical protein
MRPLFNLTRKVTNGIVKTFDWGKLRRKVLQAVSLLSTCTKQKNKETANMSAAH